eukprot:jgi/Galph1/5736/GphlegSOOS_G4380.1
MNLVPNSESVFVERTVNQASSILQNDTENRKKYKKSSAQGTAGETLGDEADKGDSQGRTINLSVAKKAERMLKKESSLFRNTLNFEKRLNSSLRKKQASIREATAQLENHVNSFSYRYFRVYVFNLFYSQQEQESDAIPCWSLRIQGRSLPSTESPDKRLKDIPKEELCTTDDRVGVEGEQETNQTNEDTWRFTNLFEKVVVEFDRQLYPDNYLFEWSSEGDPVADGIEITKSGNQETLVKIWLYPINKSGSFKLSSQLAALLGTSQSTYLDATFGLWNYIKSQKLQSAEEKSSIILDQILCDLFNEVKDSNEHKVSVGELIKLSQLVSVIRRHLLPNDPVLIEYPVKLGGNWMNNLLCFDIRFDTKDEQMSDWVSKELKDLLVAKPWEENKTFKAYEEQYYEALEKMIHYKRRRDFFDGFARNPVQFVNYLIISQTRDLKIISGNRGRNPEEERLSSFYGKQWVHEAVPRYLFRKVIQDAAHRQRDSSAHSFQGNVSKHSQGRQQESNYVSSEGRKQVMNAFPKVEQHEVEERFAGQKDGLDNQSFIEGPRNTMSSHAGLVRYDARMNDSSVPPSMPAATSLMNNHQNAQNLQFLSGDHSSTVYPK